MQRHGKEQLNSYSIKAIVWFDVLEIRNITLIVSEGDNMFWIGFFSIYVILVLLILMMIGSGKLFDKLATMLGKAKTVGCAVMFTLLSFVFTLFYSMVAIVTGNIVLNALLCAIFLVFSWFVVEKLYQLMAGENGCEDEEIKTLVKEDKNVCNLFSLIGVMLSSVALCYEDRSLEYVMLISIAISIGMGAYIPVSEIYKGTSIKELVHTIATEFKSEKVSVWISAIMSAIIVTILGFKNEVVLKLNAFVEEFGIGMAMGSIVLILILAIAGLCRKNK